MILEKSASAMFKYFENLTRALLGIRFHQLSEEEKRVIQSIARGEAISENVNQTFAEESTLGQRVADRIAAFGGSWPFILSFILFIFLWVVINSIYLAAPKQAFDPYPYILLNLFLSTLAAIQAPIIMMSQNRQAAKDHIEQDARYQVNLKSELEIMRLHQRLDLIFDKLDIPNNITPDDPS